jgi:Uma2 family endonuclease
MNAPIAPPRMTTDDLLALPDNGMERELIRGELRERRMEWRSRRHGRTEARVAYFLGDWLRRGPEPRGEVLDGGAGFRIRRDPDTTVGIDVAYVSAQLSSSTAEEACFVDGAPTLAVEILAPSDQQEWILEKVSEYLVANVPLVWVLEPGFHTVAVYRPGAAPELFNATQEVSGDPHLPGFRVKVADLFSK